MFFSLQAIMTTSTMDTMSTMFKRLMGRLPAVRPPPFPQLSDQNPSFLLAIIKQENRHCDECFKGHVRELELDKDRLQVENQGDDSTTGGTKWTWRHHWFGDQYEVQFDSDMESDYLELPLPEQWEVQGVKRRAPEIQFKDQYEVQFDSDSDYPIPFSDSDE